MYDVAILLITYTSEKRLVLKSDNYIWVWVIMQFLDPVNVAAYTKVLRDVHTPMVLGIVEDLPSHTPSRIGLRPLGYNPPST